MAINVNRVTLGFNFDVKSNEYYTRIAGSCPVATALPDGSRLVCKAGGTAWFVAPSCTQVAQTFVNSSAASAWNTLNTALINNGFNPNDWFVPDNGTLGSAGYACRSNWDSFCSAGYWSSSEFGGAYAFFTNFANGAGSPNFKSATLCVRAFRCVTY